MHKNKSQGCFKVITQKAFRKFKKEHISHLMREKENCINNFETILPSKFRYIREKYFP